MADVDDRAQLMLVGALVLAVIFVTLAVLLNAAIYTGNVATRDAGPGTGEAIEYENEATAMGRATIESLNERESLTEAERRQNFTDAVAAWSESSRVHTGTSLAATTVTTLSVNNGTVVVQDEDREFTGNGDEQGWDIATDTESRGFVLNVSRSSLATLNESEDYVFSESVRFRFNDGDGARTVQVYTRDNSTDVWVGVGGTGASPIGECSVDPGADGRILVDIKGGTVGGTACEPLTTMFDALTVPYDIRIENGDLANGTYSTFVDSDVGDVSVTTNEDADGPYAAAVIYDAKLELRYRTATIDYESTFRVAPGEHDV